MAFLVVSCVFNSVLIIVNDIVIFEIVFDVFRMFLTKFTCCLMNVQRRLVIL